MSASRRPRTDRRLVVALVVAAVLVQGVQVGAFLGLRALVDRHEQVSDLRLDAALETFRPPSRAGLAQPLAASAFADDRTPRADPARCAALTVLASGAPLDGRTWTGVNGAPAQPVTLLVLRYPDADDARRELDRKRWAMLRCPRVEVTFPPYEAPPVTYTVEGRDWGLPDLGTTVRWALAGGGKRFDFYVRRYGNTLSWTYADDVSTPAVREQVVDSLDTRLAELARG